MAGATGGSTRAFRRHAALMLARQHGPLAIGLVIAAVGEAIRIWAAGHLEKGREVTRSGPYGWTRHPLYVGSSIMAPVIVIASRTYDRRHGAEHLHGVNARGGDSHGRSLSQRRFGDSYDRYRESREEPSRGGSASRARSATGNIAPRPGSRPGSRCLR